MYSKHSSMSFYPCHSLRIICSYLPTYLPIYLSTYLPANRPSQGISGTFKLALLLFSTLHHTEILQAEENQIIYFPFHSFPCHPSNLHPMGKSMITYRPPPCIKGQRHLSPPTSRCNSYSFTPSTHQAVFKFNERGKTSRTEKSY